MEVSSLNGNRETTPTYFSHNSSLSKRNVHQHITGWQRLRLFFINYKTSLQPGVHDREVCITVNTIPHKRWCGLLFINQKKRVSCYELEENRQSPFTWHINFLQCQDQVCLPKRAKWVDCLYAY